MDVEKPHWLPDSACSKCCMCDVPFTFFRRRHHCRRCGKIFCHTCSSRKKAVLEYNLPAEVRVCDSCFTALTIGDVVDALSLPRWSSLCPVSTTANAANKADSEEGLVPVRPDINHKIIFWVGDAWTLEVDALAFPTSSSYDEKTGVARPVYELGGPQLATACAGLEPCKTGEVSITRGYNLPARHLLHTVGPMYKPVYATAAETGLHQCYRRALECVKENALTSLAVAALYTPERFYPRQDAAKVALRTIRRFLERHGQGIDAVIICVKSTADQSIYTRLLPLYFPRTPEESRASNQLSVADLGNEIGERVIQERSISIGLTPDAATNTRATLATTNAFPASFGASSASADTHDDTHTVKMTASGRATLRR